MRIIYILDLGCFGLKDFFLNSFVENLIIDSLTDHSGPRPNEAAGKQVRKGFLFFLMC